MKRHSLLMMLLLLIAGCGGGGGGGATAPQPRSATVSLSLAGPAAANQVGTVQVFVNLPAGVTVNSTISNGIVVPAAGVVTLQGQAATTNAFLDTTYNAALSRVGIRVVSTNGLSVPGALLTVSCIVPVGSTAVPADFTVSADPIGPQPTGVADLNNGNLPNVSVQASTVIN